MKTKRLEILNKLKSLYLKNCEDPIDGTFFDMAVIEAIEKLIKEFCN